MTRKPKIVIEVASGIFQRIFANFECEDAWIIEVNRITPACPVPIRNLKTMQPSSQQAVEDAERGNS